MRRAALLAVAATVWFGLVVPATAQAQPSNYRAVLSGAQEVPARDTLARGVATFQLSDDGTELDYRLVVYNVGTYDVSIEDGEAEVTALDGRADICSFGASCCELVTGRPPFRAPKTRQWRTLREPTLRHRRHLQRNGKRNHPEACHAEAWRRRTDVSEAAHPPPRNSCGRRALRAACRPRLARRGPRPPSCPRGVRLG